jgi:hypothetical protein
MRVLINEEIRHFPGRFGSISSKSNSNKVAAMEMAGSTTTKGLERWRDPILIRS